MSTVPLFLSLAGVHISLSEKEVLTDAPQQRWKHKLSFPLTAHCRVISTGFTTVSANSFTRYSRAVRVWDVKWAECQGGLWFHPWGENTIFYKWGYTPMLVSTHKYIQTLNGHWNVVFGCMPNLISLRLLYNPHYVSFNCHLPRACTHTLTYKDINTHITHTHQ